MAAARRLQEQVRAALPHLSPRQMSALTDVVERLVDAFHPDRIYVFGSKARGTPRPDSDIDVLIVVSAAEEPAYRLAAQAYALVAPLPLPLEFLFMTRAEFDARAAAAASLPATVLREGRLLYAA
jgi:predicted nucleotidyltransferase